MPTERFAVWIPLKAMQTAALGMVWRAADQEHKSLKEMWLPVSLFGVHLFLVREHTRCLPWHSGSHTHSGLATLLPVVYCTSKATSGMRPSKTPN